MSLYVRTVYFYCVALSHCAIFSRIRILHEMLQVPKHFILSFRRDGNTTPDSFLLSFTLSRSKTLR